MSKKSFFLRVQLIVRVTALLTGLVAASVAGGSLVVSQNFRSSSDMSFFRELSEEAGERYDVNVAILPVLPELLEEGEVSRGLTPLATRTIKQAASIDASWSLGYSVIYKNPLTGSSRCTVWGGGAESADGFEQLYYGISGDTRSQYAVMHEVGHCIGHSFLSGVDVIKNSEFFDSIPVGLHIDNRTDLHYQYLSEVFADLFALKSLYDAVGGMPEREAQWLLRKRQTTARRGYLAYGGILPFITGYDTLKSSSYARALAPGDFAREVMESIFKKDRTAGLKLLIDGLYMGDIESTKIVDALFGDVEVLL